MANFTLLLGAFVALHLLFGADEDLAASDAAGSAIVRATAFDRLDA